VASATDTVCEGEILQTQARGNFDLPQQQYFKMLTMKTAELFALSCDLGAFLAGDQKQREALRQYGLALGTAYQVYDDCLDLFGSEKAAGKTVGADMTEGKMTLPLLIVRDKAPQADQAALRHCFSHWNPDRMPELLGLMTKYRALALSRDVIRGYLAAANLGCSCRLRCVACLSRRVGRYRWTYCGRLGVDRRCTSSVLGCPGHGGHCRCWSALRNERGMKNHIRPKLLHVIRRRETNAFNSQHSSSRCVF